MWTKTANITATPTLGGPPTTQYKETLCFEPKALILWGTAGGPSSPLEWRFGFCSSTSDEIAKRLSVDFGSSTYTNAVDSHLPSGIDLVSFDSDGFMLNFPDTSTRDLSYTAIGGASLESYGGSFVCTAGSSSDIAVTGVGFQPDFILVMQGTIPPITATGTLGMASGPSNQGVIGFSRSVLGGTGKYFNTDRLGAFQGDVYLKTFDSDGFTLGFRPSGAASSNTTYYFLALRDPTASFYVGSDSQKTSTGTKATTGVGFQPGAGWFMHSGNTSTGNNTSSPTAHVFSAADGTNENALGGYSYTSGTDYTYGDSDLLPFVDSAGSVVANAHLDSFNSDGFTLDWVNADAVARLFLYAMFETENPENDACAEMRAFIPWIQRVN